MRQRPDTDDEPTLVRPPAPRAASPGVQLGHMLPIGSHLRDYEITGVIGEGGFGIVYLAYDHSLQRRVAVKEYMPSSMASRASASAEVRVKSERHEETFRAGLKSFVNEGRLLARFDHPALVKVYRFWEDNGTAYMVMPYYEGPTLKSALAARAAPPDETALRSWLRPLLDALAVMHAAQCYHRDIAPDNILLTPTGPLLLDFGAARRVIGDMTHALTVVLKPGYAPIEQYGDIATMTQGAWTDLYALACVVYFAITRKVPMSSVERLMDDRLEPLSRLAAGRCSPGFLRAIDAALAVRPHDRPQTVAEFRALLDIDAPVEPAPAVSQWLAEPDPPIHLVSEPSSASSIESSSEPTLLQTRIDHRPAQAHPAAAPDIALASLPDVVLADSPAPHTGASPRGLPSANATSASPRRLNRTPSYATGAAVVILALGAAVFHFFGGRPDTSAPVAQIVPAPIATGRVAGSTNVATSAPPATTALGPTRALPAASVAPALEAAPAPALASADPAAVAPAAPAIVEATPNPDASRRARAEAVRTQSVRVEPMRIKTARAEVLRIEPEPTAAVPAAAPVRSAAVQARCSDTLQRASLETLTAAEVAFLKGECR